MSRTLTARGPPPGSALRCSNVEGPCIVRSRAPCRAVPVWARPLESFGMRYAGSVRPRAVVALGETGECDGGEQEAEVA